MDHIDRVGLALDYIETHLSDNISLEEIACQAHSSLFWFHRVFSLLLGDSLGEYLRKRRLNCAAEELVTSKRKIIEIALQYGFSSHEAFTRAFYKYFGITPSQYRKSGLIALRRNPVTVELLRKERKIQGGIMSTETIINPGIRIIELPACRMASSQGHNLEEFDRWWTALDKERPDRFYVRDFMYYDAEAKELVWLYPYPSSEQKGVKYAAVDFKGGLYAVAISRDGDDIDGERVVSQIKEWVIATKYFQIDESAERPLLFHVTTTDCAFEKLGYRQLDLYVPIK
jgi:AraC-like DNA-binding protein